MEAAVMESKLLDPSFQYTTEAKTDVTKTFLKHGWVPPCREKQRATARKLNPSQYS